jgi:two-component sensor histidine kinase
MARGDLAELSGADRQGARERAFRLLASTVAALFIAFAGLAAIFFWYDYASRWVIHTHEVRAGIADVLQGMSDAESGERAYLLTHDPRFLDQIERARATAARRVAEVLQQTADNADQQVRVRALPPLMAKRMAVVDDVIRHASANDLPGAVAVIRKGEGIRAMEGIRAIVAAADAAEAQLEVDRDRRARLARGLAAGTLVVFAVLLSLLFAKAMRDLSLDREVEAETADRLRELVTQRTLLLDEVNHRVKNSLQQIAGVVRLQSRATQQPQVREALEKTLSRIMAVGRVHEQVYKAEGRLGVFDAGAYAEQLARDLVQSMGRDNVTLATEADPALLDLSHAGPIALILNELVTNGLKYGCPDDAPCVLKVEFRQVGEDYRLSVVDEGPGLPADFDLAGPSTLGLRAVDALARQLGGHVEVAPRDRGAEFAVLFPKRAA